MTVRKFPEQLDRVETGPIQFGNDWPGVFIRGDEALYFARVLESHMNDKEPEQFFEQPVLSGLVDTLRRCAEPENEG